MLKFFVSLQNRVAELRDREDGQAFVEYGVLLAIVAIGLIVLLTTFRNDICDALNAIGRRPRGRQPSCSKAHVVEPATPLRGPTFATRTTHA